MKPLRIPWFQKAKLDGMNRIIEQNEEMISILRDIKERI